MNSNESADVQSSDRGIRSPPNSLIGRLSYLGPSMILSASIVGSGELILTTTLGAQAGFVALWVVIVSCLVKVCVQLQFGMHAISCGESTMTALNLLSGPRFNGACWTIWLWLLVQLAVFVQYGGIATGVGQAIHLAIPTVPVGVCAGFAGLTAAVLVSFGRYRTIESVCLVLMALFTVFTLLCVGLLQYTQYAISFDQIESGLAFQLPTAVVGVAVAAFGLTGVGASEIITYPYWCLEKGYAEYAGPREQSEAWVMRARGWIRVMYLDAFLSMLVYTLVTCAFYVLGAAVLHGRGEVPQGTAMMRTLSTVYTEAAGSGAMMLYLIGAIIVLFSTLFAGTAAWTRVFSDALGVAGILDLSDAQRRRNWIRGLAWFFPITFTVLGLTFKAPVMMVTAGGLANASLLLLVVYAAWTFRYRRLPVQLRPGRLYDVLLWVSFVSITAVGLLAVVKALS